MFTAKTDKLEAQACLRLVSRQLAAACPRNSQSPNRCYALPGLRAWFKYETYVDLVPGEWTRMKIEVQGVKARLFVHDSEPPTLVVNDLKQGDAKGAIALWIGPGAVAHFSNLHAV